MAETKQQSQIIHKDMTIGDAIQAFPKSSDIFLEYGLHCVGCHVNPYETIEQGARGHGMSDEIISKMIADVNKASSQDKIKKEKYEYKSGINLTDAASSKMKDLLKENGSGVRIEVLAGGCAGHSYNMEIEKNPAENDNMLEVNEIKLFVDPESMKLLDGVEIDYIETIQQSGFKFNNPQASSTCGCGKSFG